ncbi:purine and uridine phosphorylase [Coprinellus micaceus]|uniref:Purine and uridine phosphorylase n=1 Tax=Coprinellus micaceus TaxID=71717 RepID=A0A4Y7SL18_COPMI|nr:purine and uridine phosphorylase [Coprinellus micaceus]
MKQTLTDANFPRTADHRVYHLGLRPGEVANRIITVGSPSRANGIATHLDTEPKPFVLTSERGFTTITGRFRGVPVSIVSIGMGFPNMDFFVREVRECISGDMLIIRLGSCGALVDVPVGSVVIPSSSVAISRNYDFDFANPASTAEPPYRISKPAIADAFLHEERRISLTAFTYSFYSSQGRQTSFPDRNTDLIEHLREGNLNVSTLEMETFHLYHLAKCWSGGQPGRAVPAIPLTTGPVRPATSKTPPVGEATLERPLAGKDTVIRAAAVHLVYASRLSQGFITPSEVNALEDWTGLGVLTALANTEIPSDKLHVETGSVWEIKEKI